MFTKKQRGDRTFVPVTPDFHKNNKRRDKFGIGTAIILISVILAIIIGMWSSIE